MFISIKIIKFLTNLICDINVLVLFMIKYVSRLKKISA